MPSISDALMVTCRHARLGLRNRPMRWPFSAIALAREGTEGDLTYKPKDPETTFP